MDYNNSPNFGEQWKKTLSPDFNSIFGESYRANDVYYRAKAKNVHGYESAWTAWTGIHRYNGRPSIPQYPAVDGKNDLLYDTITFSWQASTDPDGDSLYYQLYLTARDANGSILKMISLVIKLLIHLLIMIYLVSQIKHLLYLKLKHQMEE